MTGTAQVIDRWVNMHTYVPNARSIRSSNCFFEGPILYSYGHHFELARAIKDPKTGATTTFLLNGDQYSITTSGQQSQVRAVTRASGVRTVIIPFSALTAAEVDLSTVRILDVTDDRWVDTEHTSQELLPEWRWRTEEIRERRVKSDADIQKILDEHSARARESVERSREWYRAAEEKGDERGMSVWRSSLSDEPQVYTREHLTHWELHEDVVAGHVTRLYTSGTYRTRVTVHDDGDGTHSYSWTTSRHWLGESLIEADVSWTSFVRCRACNGRGEHPAKVHAVRGAVTAGQFPDTGEGPFLGMHTRTPHYVHCQKCSGRGGNWRTGRRHSKFLSGFDRGERRPSYFFCELPRTDATTVEEAYDALKPDPVKLAEAMDRPVQRQGDIFAVEMRTLDKRSLRKSGAVFTRRGNLLGTNHRATETAQLRDGTLLARGTLTHDPDGRRPDHSRVKLGNAWHVIVKNTVPIAA